MEKTVSGLIYLKWVMSLSKLVVSSIRNQLIVATGSEPLVWHTNSACCPDLSRYGWGELSMDCGCDDGGVLAVVL